MKLNDYIDQQYAEKISILTQQMHQHIQKKPISDVVDEHQNQYIDIVFEGGGVFGIALVGYTYALEQAGIRFLNMAGTSAGAINALLLAALGKPNEIKSDKMLEILAEMPMKEFVDGGKTALSLVNDIKKNPKGFTDKIPELLMIYFTNFQNKKFYVNAGQKFETWLEKN